MIFVGTQEGKIVYLVKSSQSLQKIKFQSNDDLQDKSHSDYQEYVTYNRDLELFLILRKSYTTGLVSIYSVHENQINQAIPQEEQDTQLNFVLINLKYELNNPEYIHQEILGIQTNSDKLYIIFTSQYIFLYVNQLKPSQHVISHELIFKPSQFFFTPKNSVIIVNPCKCQFIFFYRNAYFHKIYKNQEQSEQTFIVHAKQIENTLLKEYNLLLQVPGQLKTMEYEEVLEAQIQSIQKDDAKVQILLACYIGQQIIILRYEGQFENNFKYELKGQIFQTREARNWLLPIQDSNQHPLNIAYQNQDSKYFIEQLEL